MDLLLCRAVAAGDLARVSELLPLVPYYPSVLLAGTPLLSVAADLGYADVVEALLGRAAPEAGSRAALRFAWKRDHVPTVSAIAARLAGPALGAELVEVAREGSEEAAAELIRLGADVNSMSLERGTALVAAVEQQREGMAALLLRGGSSPDAAGGVGGHRGSPLAVAVRLGHESLVAALLEAGAAVDERSGGGVSGQTPLRVAVGRGFVRIAAVLLRAGADPGQALLAMAAASASPALVRVILEAGADVNAVNDHGETALSRANGGAVVALLVAHGAAVDVRAKDGQTPLARAINAGSLAAASALRAAGADLVGEIDPLRLRAYEQYRAERIEQRYALLLVTRGRLSVHVAREVAAFV